MDWYRIRHTIGMYLTISPMKRAEYLKRKKIFRHVGNNCMVMFRKIPLFPKMISFGDNVWIASNVSFITHDVVHHMLNYRNRGVFLNENIGCIEIKDNVFIGANASILPNVSVGPDTIIAAGTVVNKSIGSGVYAGVPARYICSLEEFINKRTISQKDIEYSSSNGGLSLKTVETLWDSFIEKNEENNNG